ncbi:MAG: oxidoreductase C-terminal domain-containing protein [Solirubrobacteraceae bacterium]
MRFQYLGYAAEGDAMTVDGDPAQRDASAVWTRDGQPVAALLIGRPRQMPALRRAIEQTFEPIQDRSVSA